eukprot:Rhum_TRINITY_DN22810_c0_g1::Rhum_TRINITY_DN22810_c0_g1_i1::g.176114::m.176114
MAPARLGKTVGKMWMYGSALSVGALAGGGTYFVADYAADYLAYEELTEAATVIHARGEDRFMTSKDWAERPGAWLYDVLPNIPAGTAFAAGVTQHLIACRGEDYTKVLMKGGLPRGVYLRPALRTTGLTCLVTSAMLTQSAGQHTHPEAAATSAAESGLTWLCLFGASLPVAAVTVLPCCFLANAVGLAVSRQFLMAGGRGGVAKTRFGH